MIAAGIGMAIAVTALVAPALGARDLARARRLSTHAAVFAAGASLLMVAALWLALSPLLGGLALTQLATPAGGAVVTAVMAQFGHGAVAGWTVIGRLIPIAFGAIFSLSASVGPVIGQNLGAGEFGRVRAALKVGLGLAAAITVTAWLVLALATPALVAIFNATGEAAQLIAFFCRWLAPLFVFFGTLFVCNAACNTLGRPHYAAALNWGRATLGTVPFVMLGSTWGPEGVLLGHMAGGVAFGIAAVVVVQRLIARLEAG
jgi:MATE family, multidrug efflux pump